MMPVPPGPSGETTFYCPTCNRLLRAPLALAGQTIQCPRCNNWAPVPHSDAIEPAGDQGAAGRNDPYVMSRPAGRDNPYGLSESDRQLYERLRREPPPPEGGLSNAAIGWVVFFLIFVVGNIILYSTTGIFLIPIPRR